MSPWEGSVWLLLILDGFAVYRLTRLATLDKISHPARLWIVRRAYRDPDLEADPAGLAELVSDDADAPKLATLVTCRWCASVHIAAAVVALRTWAPALWGPVAYLLTLASVAVLLATMEDRH